MANPSLEAFLNQVKANPALLNEMQRCPNLEGIAAMGAGLGYTFSGVDVLIHQAEATLRLSPSELEAAAAGVNIDGHLWLMQIVWS